MLVPHQRMREISREPLGHPMSHLGTGTGDIVRERRVIFLTCREE
jgi:hypothetical protein